jgi:hypothetical protein
MESVCMEKRQKPASHVKRVRFHRDTFPSDLNDLQQDVATNLNSDKSRHELLQIITELEAQIVQQKEEYFLEQQLSARKNTILAKISKEVIDRSANQAAQGNEIREVRSLHFLTLRDT